jgi:putative addiction module component (TIGR02574 family)
MILERFPEVQNLSIEDKAELATELWEEVEKAPHAVLEDEAFRKELLQLVKDYEENPGQGRTWEQVKARALASRR